jgi:hypothetical protein
MWRAGQAAWGEPAQYPSAYLMQHRAERLWIALQKVAQALAHRQYPVTHRQRREDLVQQMRRQRSYLLCVAGETRRAAITTPQDSKAGISLK